MELFVLGLVFGAATAQGKAVTKAVAKGYMAVSEKTRETVSTLREDMREAIDEARTERDKDDSEPLVSNHDSEALALMEETVPINLVESAPPVAAPVAAVSKPKQSPMVMKSLAKRYLAMTEKTRDAVSGIRENVRDAIEEARYERELAAQRAAKAEADATPTIDAEVDTVTIAETKQTAAPTAKTKIASGRSTRTKAPSAVAISDAPGARSTRTKTAAIRTATETAPPDKPAAVNGKPTRSKKSAGTAKVSPTEALLEVAEIAADAL
jgi:ribosome recycling factor